MRAIARRIPGIARKIPAAVRKTPSKVWRGVQGLPRAPKVLAKKRLSQSLLTQLRLFPVNERRIVKTKLNLLKRRTYALRDAAGNFHTELRDANNEAIEDRVFNSSGLLTRLTKYVPNEGNYVWNYPTPGGKAVEQGARTGAHMQFSSRRRRTG